MHAPTWAPARLKVLVAATQVIRRSAISGAAVSVGVCLAPSKTRSQWISSETRIRPCSAQKVASARSSCADQTVPPGLCGLHRKTTLRARRQLFAQRIEIHRVAALGLDELRIENAPVIGQDDPAEGVVGRRKDDHFVARRGHRLQDQAEPGDDAGRRAHPVGVDLQAVAPRHPVCERGRPGAGVGVIAVGSALDLGGERRRHARRGGEIHVRDPHRDGVRRLDAGELRDVVPLRRMRVAALDDAVEVEHGVSTLRLADRTSLHQSGVPAGRSRVSAERENHLFGLLDRNGTRYQGTARRFRASTGVARLRLIVVHT